MATTVTIAAGVEGLGVGIVEATAIRLGPSGEALNQYKHDVVRRTLTEGMHGGEERRAAVRQLLRAGGYRPAGRNKPAQEYLLRTIAEQAALPDILNAVDLINAVSLDCGLPISLISLTRGGPQLELRYGRPGESYTFNRAGQDLDLAGLICVCGAGSDTPLGTPVKDSLLGKVADGDERVVACIYAPRAAVNADELREWADRLGHGMVEWCGAASCSISLVPDSW